MANAPPKCSGRSERRVSGCPGVIAEPLIHKSLLSSGVRTVYECAPLASLTLPSHHAPRVLPSQICRASSLVLSIGMLYGKEFKASWYVIGGGGV